MKWKKYTISTTTEAEDLVASALSEIGIEGAQIEDNVPLSDEDTKGMFIDILPELPPDDGTARVSFYIDPDKDTELAEEDLLKMVREKLEELRLFADCGSLDIVTGETEDADWINNWKQYFKPFMVGEILIKPTWEAIPEGWKYNICLSIDPGTAFGTGSHETTQLVLTELQKHLKPGDSILDVGTGSGILSIAALKLGAAHAIGTDLDEAAVNASKENMAENGISEKDFELILGNIIDDESVKASVGDETCDIVVANILAPVILLLQREIPRHLKRGGVFIMSGILAEQEGLIADAIRSNDELKLASVSHQGDWISMTAIRV
jgi:ribosomal protein L11 methyltransferase